MARELTGTVREILGTCQSVGCTIDGDAAQEMLRIYNDWLHEFCKAAPDRLVGLSNIPNYNMEESVAEAMRIPFVTYVGQRGGPSTGTVIYSQQELNMAPSSQC